MSTMSIKSPVGPGSPELEALLATIAEGAAERDRDRVAPHEQIALIREAGLGRLRLSVADGGAGARVRELFSTLIALAAADSNVAHILRTHYSFVEQQLQNRDASSRARWFGLIAADEVFGNAISEQGDRGVGEPFHTTLSSDPKGGGYRLDGTKYYSTGTLYATYTQVLASTPAGDRIVAATIPVDREGVTIVDDWDGFGQRLTGTGTTLLDAVRVEPHEVSDFGPVDGERPPTYQGAVLQLYLQAVTAGILRAIRDDAAALVHRRRRSFDHVEHRIPAQDPQYLQVVGTIAADAFAAEAIVLAAADAIQVAADSVGADGLPSPDAARDAQLAAAQAKVAVDGFAARTATALFDAGGASATRSAYNLDRHWRNVRTISTHNPAHWKATVVGDHLVNGVAPPNNGLF
ncbi:MAG TPA: hypothetical protein VNT03_03280 [Baekduia sp.]|nr:hypothetical protein [Baekduia sp.]